MNKCEWKDGKFIACELWLKNRIHDFHHYVREDVTYCPFCGADIRKPKQEVIIKRSGQTWVARYEGVDYLAINSSRFGCVGRMCMTDNEGVKELIEEGVIKPISEIEITDEIAKLRCLVMWKNLGKNSDKMVLYGVNNKIDSGCFVYHVKNDDLDRWNIKDLCLATVDDLED